MNMFVSPAARAVAPSLSPSPSDISAALMAVADDLLDPLACFRNDTSIRPEQGVLFTTYATLRIDAREERVSRAAQIGEWLGSDRDGVVVFDESHTILGAVMERYPRARIADRAAA